MPALVWLASVRRDLAAIISYIAERDPAAARRLRTSIEQAMGMGGRAAGITALAAALAKRFARDRP